MDSPICVTVVTGFLGAGKSTLVEKWVAELPRDETAVIVNERGDVGIDGELLEHVSRVREITGGCVCCSGQGELMTALLELSQAIPAPRRIFVETSGAASPAAVIRGVAAPRVRESLRVDGVITVIDRTRIEKTLAFDIAAEQLGFADVVVLSRSDQVDWECREENAGVDLVRQHAPAAVLVDASMGVPSLGFEELLARRVETLHVPAPHRGHAIIEAASCVLEGELDEELFLDWVEGALGAVEAGILRVKGILAIRDVEARVILQGVGGDVEVLVGRAWGSQPRSSRLVVLGLGLDSGALEEGFTRCAWSGEVELPRPKH